MNSNILLVVAIVALAGAILLVEAHALRLGRRVRELEIQGHDHLDTEPEMSASEPHGEPPPAFQPPRHAEPMKLQVLRTDTAGLRKIGPADLDVVAPWLDQSPHPKPVRAPALVARHAAKEN